LRWPINRAAQAETPDIRDGLRDFFANCSIMDHKFGRVVRNWRFFDGPGSCAALKNFF